MQLIKLKLHFLNAKLCFTTVLMNSYLTYFIAAQRTWQASNSCLQSFNQRTERLLKSKKVQESYLASLGMKLYLFQACRADWRDPSARLRRHRRSDRSWWGRGRGRVQSAEAAGRRHRREGERRTDGSTRQAEDNKAAHFKKCKQLFEYEHLLLIRDILRSMFSPIFKCCSFFSTPVLIRHLAP